MALTPGKPASRTASPRPSRHALARSAEAPQQVRERPARRGTPTVPQPHGRADTRAVLKDLEVDVGAGWKWQHHDPASTRKKLDDLIAKRGDAVHRSRPVIAGAPPPPHLLKRDDLAKAHPVCQGPGGSHRPRTRRPMNRIDVATESPLARPERARRPLSRALKTPPRDSSRAAPGSARSHAALGRRRARWRRAPGTPSCHRSGTPPAR